MIIVAIKYYDGWREHGRYLYRKTLEAEQDETEDTQGEDIITF